MRRQKRCTTGGCWAAFGAGLLLATICPPEAILVFAALALVLLGCSRVRSR